MVWIWDLEIEGVRG